MGVGRKSERWVISHGISFTIVRNSAWPAQLSLPAIDTYLEPGVVVEVVDSHGAVRYPFANGTSRSVPISAEASRAVLAGQTLWYTKTVEGEHVRVEAVPFRAPLPGRVAMG